MSVLLFPPPDLAETAWLTALGAVATAEIVADWTGRDARIKWPNDVRVDGRKVAGVLVERGQGAVIGIGLNANLEAGDFPPELRDAATSLRILGGRPVDRSELARALIRRLDDWYDAGRIHGPASLNPPWRDRSEHLGRAVRITTPRGSLDGRLDDLHLEDGLRLTRLDGPRRIPPREVLSLQHLEAEDAS
jgi:BirA family biotin operon repressor/biotin-[acetyl-CoA-carboxylase] ligase